MVSYYMRASGGDNGNTELSVTQGWDTVAYAESQAIAEAVAVVISRAVAAARINYIMFW